MKSNNSTFPSLSTAMDIEAVKDLLQDVLKKDHPHIEIIEGIICDVKYDPNKEFVLLYRFKLRNRLTNRSHKQFFTAKVLKKTDTLPKEPAREIRMRYENLEDIWIHRPSLYLPHHKIVLYPYPNDLKLPWLIDTIDPHTMKECFNKLWAFQKMKARKVKVKLLGYTPHMRASFLYNVLVENKQSQSREWRQIIGKTNVFKKPDRLFASAWALWQASEGTIGFAQPVGFMMQPRLTFQEKVQGERLGRLVDSPSINVIIKETARAIARFHSLSIPLKTKRKLKDEICSVERWSNVIMEICPDLRSRLEIFLDKMIKEIGNRMRMRTPVHADFHHTNVLVDGTTVRLIDLDEMAFGDPCVDTGRFLASLRIPALRTYGSIDKLNSVREMFLDEYIKIRPENVSNIRLFESASLLTSAASAFRIQRPNWQEEVSILVDEAENIFRLSRKGKGISVQANGFTDFEIKANDRLRWALDATYMQTVLTPFLKENYNVNFLSCIVSRKKKIHSGYLIQYKVSGWVDNKKWKKVIMGLILKGGRGGTLFKRLSLFNKSLKNTEAAHLLPRAIGYMPQIGTLIIEPVEGKPFSTLLGTPDAIKATTTLAGVLSTLHGTQIEHSKNYSLDREFSLLRNKIDQLENDYPNFCSMALPLFSNIDARREYLNDETSPILYTLRPQNIFYSDNNIHITEIAKLRFSHPYIDVGNFLAQITIMGIKNNLLKETEKIVEQFRDSYHSATGKEENGFSTIEASAFINLACSELERTQKDAFPLKLLEHAQKRLEPS